MKKGSIFICFIGIDGSGKTTQAESLVETLAHRGIKSKYIYNRFSPFLVKPFMSIGKVLFFRGKGKFENYEGYSFVRGRVFKNRPLSVAYQYCLLLDYSLQSLMRLSLPKIRGQSIVCDRYIHDTVVDIAVDLNHSRTKLKNTLQRFLLFLPKPDFVFLIDVPEEIAYQRKIDIPSIDFLKERREFYLDIGREYKMVVLDGSQDKAELRAIIQTKLGEVMNWSSHH